MRLVRKEGAGGVGSHVLAWLGHSTVDHKSLSRRSTDPASNRGTLIFRGADYDSVIHSVKLSAYPIPVLLRCLPTSSILYDGSFRFLDSI